MSDFQRLSVNINSESAEILRTVTKDRGISTTEAIRRAIGLLGFFEEARRSKTKVYTEDTDGHRASLQVSDCRQVVIAVVLSPGRLSAWLTKIMPGNTSDKTTLKHFLEKIQAQSGKAQRIWVMDRGIPTERTFRKCAKAIPPPFRIWSAPRAPAGINSKMNGQSSPGETSRHGRSRTARPRR